MKSYINLLFFVVLVILFSAALAQQPAGNEKAASIPDANQPRTPDFPYVAEITGDDVNIRPGPGTQYYVCGKLNKADRVKILSARFSWSCIVPPKGSFSWISTQYVTTDPDKPEIGTVTGDAVRVYAGSDEIKPMHSTFSQGKLNKGDKVTLLGEEQDDYYKIAPPSFAYLWVSTQYINPLGSVGDVPVVVKPMRKPKPKPGDTAAVAPAMMPHESRKLKEYHALAKQIKDELKKPLDQQDYSNYKEALTAIADDKEAGKAARFAKYALGQIDRYELARKINKEVQLQDEQLQKNKERIEKARAASRAQIKNLGSFAAIGKLLTSEVYGKEPQLVHYKILDEAGKIVCYALPTDKAAEMDLSEFLDHKVGLVGTIEPHVQTSSALVRFTEITKLD